MPNEPFMPTVEMTKDTKIQTTWGVLQKYRDEIATRDQKIADLIIERDALGKEVNRQKVALSECHKEIFKLRDTLLSHSVES